MKFICLAAIAIIMWAHGVAQQDYYVFIQQPGGQPFYVRMGEQSYSSTAGGHLLLAPMKDTLYNMYIGFPRSRHPEQLFNVRVDKKDRGFELKQFDGQWQLQDLQTQQLLRAEPRKVQPLDGTKRTDTYSQLMAGVVDDTTVLYIDSLAYADTAAAQNAIAAAGNAVAVDSAAVNAGAAKKRRKQKTDTIAGQPQPGAGDTVVLQPTRKSDTVAAAQARRGADTASAQQPPRSDNQGAKVAHDTASLAENANRPVLYDPRNIIRFRTENVNEGKLMIFLDRSGPVTDTIRLIVPR